MRRPNTLSASRPLKLRCRMRCPVCIIPVRCRLRLCIVPSYCLCVRVLIRLWRVIRAFPSPWAVNSGVRCPLVRPLRSLRLRHLTSLRWGLTWWCVATLRSLLTDPITGVRLLLRLYIARTIPLTVVTAPLRRMRVWRPSKVCLSRPPCTWTSPN